MRRMNRAVPLALACASGLATMGLIHLYITSNQPADAIAMQPMVVTSQEVDDSEPIKESDLKVVQVVERPSGAFAATGDVVGRLPLVPVPKGQPLLSSHLAVKGEQPGLWHRIDAGKRAVTVAVDEVAGVGGFLKPGLNVDVIGVSREDGDYHSRTVAQLVPILAIAQEDKDTKGESKAKIVKSATLLVTPQQAESISLASEEGAIRLVLRAPDDVKIVKLPGEKRIKPKPPKAAAPAPAPIVYQQAPAAPAPAAPAKPKPASKPKPAALNGIEVINGTSTEVVNP